MFQKSIYIYLFGILSAVRILAMDASYLAAVTQSSMCLKTYFLVVDSKLRKIKGEATK